MPKINKLSCFTLIIYFKTLKTTTNLKKTDQSANANVLVGSSPCLVQSISSTQVVCILGQSAAGSFPVQVQITDLGYSNANVLFTYDLTLVSLSNVQGGTSGGLSLTINGAGFDATSTLVTICGVTCPITQSSFSSLTCIV